MRSFLKLFALFLLPLAVLLVLQYLLDPLDMYPGEQLAPSVVQSVRREKAEGYLEHSGRDLDAVILGSSRAMRLDPCRLTGYGYKAYNLAVHNARAEDLYCLLRLVLEHNARPLRLIVLGIDVESFHNAKPTDRNLLGCPELARYMGEAGPIGERSDEDLLRDLSTNLRLSFVSAYLSVTGELERRRVGLVPQNGNYTTTPLRPRNHSDRLDPSIVGMYRERFVGFTGLSSDRIGYFEGFLGLAAENGIRVLGFITTLHPSLDRYLARNTTYDERLEELRAYLDSLKYPNFTYRDFSLPERFGGTDADFGDSAHIGSVNAGLILDRLLEEM
ncbi:hypothetical protein KAU45_04935 [bacterium]|nr:hypothetical protein [bacterium]